MNDFIVIIYMMQRKKKIENDDSATIGLTANDHVAIKQHWHIWY